MGSDEHAAEGDQAPLMALVYDELRGLAGAYMRRERVGHTLQPTAVVNEAWLKLASATELESLDRNHFLAIASKVLRRVLVEHARGRDAAKRGGGEHPVTLQTQIGGGPSTDLDLLALEEALVRLAELDERQARVVELRFFGGLLVDEVAQVLQVSKRTVELDWSLARAFLRRELGDDAP